MNIRWNLLSVFLENLNNFTRQKNQVTLSFDIVSLCTNETLLITIDLIANYVYAENNSCYPLFEKFIFVKLMYIAT